MYLLYLDGSGSVTDPNETYFILAGVGVFERQVYWQSKALDELAATIDPHSPEDIEFHGAHILGGRKKWRRLQLAERSRIINACLDTLVRAHRSTTIFGVAVHKVAIAPRDPVEYAFEQICSRYDQFLARKHRAGERQRGLIIFDESNYETRLQALAINFRTIGHTWGVVRDILEVPLFVDSRATRLIQLADLVAYAMYRRYEKQDPPFFDKIQDRFDRDRGIIHGLVHYKREGDFSCDCPVCAQRDAARELGR